MEVRDVVKEAAGMVAREARLSKRAVLKPKGRSARRLRQNAMYLAVVGYGARLSHVAEVLGVSHYTVQYALGRVEDRRDDNDFDHWIGARERQLQDLLGVAEEMVA